MPILGQDRLSKGQVCPAGLGKGLEYEILNQGVGQWDEALGFKFQNKINIKG